MASAPHSGGPHVDQLLPRSHPRLTCHTMAVALINRLLPVEMLERVFHLLPPRDLQAVVLVCRWWREVGEAPALWVWVCLRVWRENIGYMPEVLDSRRLQAVRRVEVWEVSEG